MPRSTWSGVALAVTLAFAAPAHAVDRVPRPTAPQPSPVDSASFVPADSLTGRGEEPIVVRAQSAEGGEWLRTPFGDALLTPPEIWLARPRPHPWHVDLTLDYNRVDLLRTGLWFQTQSPQTMQPRLGARLGYATGRERALYGVQLEQPLLPTARFVAGIERSRVTDHPDLEQIDDLENSLLLLVAHEDWRDYFEREGSGAYLSWRVPDFSTVSLHLREDDWRSLASSRHVFSLARNDRPLRDNPAIDDGTTHSVILRLERLAHRTRRSRGGFYHWIELERAGNGLGGDFDYTRALADLRSVMRLTPGTSIALRTTGGAALSGTLPLQRQFALGGADGLRAHPFGSFHGDRVALAQAEYSVGLRPLRAKPFEGGMQALAFVDAGTAWLRSAQDDLADQRFAVDGGVGLATSDDDLRLTFARNLQQSNAAIVVSLRLQRPF